MGDLYKTIEQLCRERGVSITEMCRSAGIPRANLTELKMGRQQTLGTASLEKIAAYFGVTVGYLIDSETEKAPDSEEPRALTRSEIKHALFGADAERVPEEKLDEVLRYAEIIKYM